MTDQLYVFRWGKYRPELKGKLCRVLARGSMNTALVRFVEEAARKYADEETAAKGDAVLVSESSTPGAIRRFVVRAVRVVRVVAEEPK